jgi:hypothetical protein
MKLIYVTHPKLVMDRYAIMVENQEALDNELAKREQAIRDFDWKAKVERDKAGSPLFHELNPGWDKFVPEKWSPN